MKQVLRAILPTLAALFLFSGCGQDCGGLPPELRALHDCDEKRWKFVKWEELARDPGNEKAFRVEDAETPKSCRTDDRLIFNADGSLQMYYGSEVCADDPPRPGGFASQTYAYDAEQRLLVFGDGASAARFVVEELTKKSLVIRGEERGAIHRVRLEAE